MSLESFLIPESFDQDNDYGSDFLSYNHFPLDVFFENNPPEIMEFAEKQTEIREPEEPKVKMEVAIPKSKAKVRREPEWYNKIGLETAIQILQDEIADSVKNPQTFADVLDPKEKKLKVNGEYAKMSRRRKLLADLEQKLHIQQLMQENQQLKKDNETLVLQNAQLRADNDGLIQERNALLAQNEKHMSGASDQHLLVNNTQQYSPKQILICFNNQTVTLRNSSKIVNDENQSENMNKVRSSL